MVKVNNNLEQYLENHTTPVSETLNRLTRLTYLSTYNPRMISGPVQGKFLELLCRIANPKRILEIGTFTGYSTICLAKGSPENALIDTIEVNDELEETIRTFILEEKLEHKINLHIGNALDILDTLTNQYDLVFIDGDKREYPEYYNKIIEKVRIGGIIIADNVLWGGKVLDKQKSDKHTQAVKQFNNLVQNDNRVENVLLPIRDGVMLIFKNR